MLRMISNGDMMKMQYLKTVNAHMCICIYIYMYTCNGNIMGALRIYIYIEREGERCKYQYFVRVLKSP